MSILLDGTTQWAHRSTFPDQSLGWSMVMWARRDEDTAGERTIAGLGADAFGARTVAKYQNNRARASHGVTGIFAGLWPTEGQWSLVFVTYSSTGTLRMRSALAGAGDWSEDIGSATDLTNLTPNSFVVGNGRTDLAATPYLGPIAFLKVWEGRILTDAEAWAEREYREPVSATDIWATYKFADGALGTDFSAGARTLTLVGTPTYTADEPADILGDNAGGITPAVITATATSWDALRVTTGALPAGATGVEVYIGTAPGVDHTTAELAGTLTAAGDIYISQFGGVALLANTTYYLLPRTTDGVTPVNGAEISAVTWVDNALQTSATDSPIVIPMTVVSGQRQMNVRTSLGKAIRAATGAGRSVDFAVLVEAPGPVELANGTALDRTATANGTESVFWLDANPANRTDLLASGIEGPVELTVTITPTIAPVV